jgi:hypothetical protein
MLAMPQQMKNRHDAQLLEGVDGRVNPEVLVQAERTVRARNQ